MSTPDDIFRITDEAAFEAAVLEGDSPTEVLLGMSFLSRVRWREENGVLQLESKL